MMRNLTQNMFGGRLHEFLTCLAVSQDLKNIAMGEIETHFFEELALKCIHKALITEKVEIWQLQLLLDDMPKILSLKYEVVSEIKNVCLQLIPQMMNVKRMQSEWLEYRRLDYIMDMLRLIEMY